MTPNFIIALTPTVVFHSFKKRLMLKGSSLLLLYLEPMNMTDHNIKWTPQRDSQSFKWDNSFIYQEWIRNTACSIMKAGSHTWNSACVESRRVLGLRAPTGFLETKHLGWGHRRRYRAATGLLDTMIVTVTVTLSMHFLALLLHHQSPRHSYSTWFYTRGHRAWWMTDYKSSKSHNREKEKGEKPM